MADEAPITFSSPPTEPEDAGKDHVADPELVELYEVLEWERQVDQ